MNVRSIITAAFLAIVPAAILAFIAGYLVGGAPTILSNADPDYGTGSGVQYGSSGSAEFWRAFLVTLVLVELIGSAALARWMHRTSN